MATNNPLLERVHSVEGTKHQIKRLVQQELQKLLHVTDTQFVINRLRAVGVNTVGSDKNMLAFWQEQVKLQMQVTHNLQVKPKVKAPEPTHKKSPLAKRLHRVVGFATSVLL